MSVTKNVTLKPGHTWTARRQVFDPKYEIVPVESNQTGSPFLTVTSSRTGERNPSYRWQISRGENATTALSGTRQSASFKTGQFGLVTINPAVNGSRIVLDLINWAPTPSLPNVPSVSLTTADNIASMKFYKHARKRLTKFRSLEFFGELGETLLMIRNPAKALRNAVTVFAKRDLKKGLKGIRGPLHKRVKIRRRIWQDIWLEAVFGWTPLFNDIYDATKAYDALTAMPRPFIMVSSKGEDETGGDVTISTIGLGPYGQKGRLCEKTFQTALVKYYGVLWTGDSSLPDASRIVGLRAHDLALAVYELTPWSFLIDYFTNIGDLISEASFHKALIRWVSKSTVRSRKYEAVATSSMVEQTLSNVVSVSGSVAKFHSERSEVSRIPAVAYPTTSFSWQIPGMSKKWINIAALLRFKRDLHP